MNRFLLTAILAAAFLPFGERTPHAPREGLLISRSEMSTLDKQPLFAKRWVYASYNLLVDDSAEQLIKLIDRAGKAGYNGVVLADFKLNVLERLPKRYAQNVARVQQAADRAGVEIIPAIFPIGYSEGLLTHDPNLAEGVPVKEAPFVVKKGRAVLEATVRLQRQSRRGRRATVSSAFRSRTIRASRPSPITRWCTRARCRAGWSTSASTTSGQLPACSARWVRPFACYRFSAWVKTQDVKPAGRISAAGPRRQGGPFTFFDEEAVKSTSDWKRSRSSSTASTKRK